MAVTPRYVLSHCEGYSSCDSHKLRGCQGVTLWESPQKNILKRFHFQCDTSLVPNLSLLNDLICHLVSFLVLLDHEIWMTMFSQTGILENFSISAG